MRKLDTHTFIERARKIHGDKYDYSKVEYIGIDKKVCIICPEHGEFWQTPHDHLSRHGCLMCYNNKRGNNLKRTKNDFIKKAKEVHGDKYDYSKVEYINDSTKVCIICPEHGEFWQTPNHHLRGHGCLQCSIKKVSHSKIKPYEEFIEKANKKHNDKYEYDYSTYVNRATKMKIICPKHGEFWQKPNNHLQGQGCPYCKDSLLEKEVESILKENQINYINKCTSQTFKWLERQHLDFYLPDYNIAIECQGIQHFEPREKFGGENEFIKIVNRDEHKKNKCIENNITILYYSSEYLKRKFNKMLFTKNNLLKKIKNA